MIELSKNPPRISEEFENQIDFGFGLRGYKIAGYIWMVIGGFMVLTLFAPPFEVGIFVLKIVVGTGFFYFLGIRSWFYWKNLIKYRKDGFVMGEYSVGEVSYHSKKFVIWRSYPKYVIRITFRRSDGLSLGSSIEADDRSIYHKFPVGEKIEALVDFENRACFIPEAVGQKFKFEKNADE